MLQQNLQEELSEDNVVRRPQPNKKSPKGHWSLRPKKNIVLFPASLAKN